MTNPVGRSGGDGQSSDARMIMLIRHAEKPLHPYGSPRGVNPDGQPDPHSLTVTGWIRAGALVELFAPSRGDPPGELRRPDTIYASAHAGGHSKRSMQTVGPLASRLGLQVVKRYAAGDEAYLVREISSRPGATLVAWHHEALHRIGHHLGEVNPTPPRHWPPDRFDVIWTFTLGDHGWRFAQIPQLLLPGDLPYPIPDCSTVQDLTTDTMGWNGLPDLPDCASHKRSKAVRRSRDTAEFIVLDLAVSWSSCCSARQLPAGATRSRWYPGRPQAAHAAKLSVRVCSASQVRE